MIELSKLVPAPLYHSEELFTQCVTTKPNGEGSIVASFYEVMVECCLTNPVEDAKFYALARNAFAVMMERWWVPKLYLGCMWSVQNGHGDYPPELLGMVDTPEPAVWIDPFTALVSADEWLKTQEAKGGTK